MREEFFRSLDQSLSELKEQHRYRSLRTYNGIDFGSNDYLGFAWDNELRGKIIDDLGSVALSSSSSRLLCGNHNIHLQAEKTFASFVNAGATLLFNSGFDANVALLTTLPSRHDLILYDEYSHASIYEGAHASYARSIRFAHNSVEDLTQQIERAVRQTLPNQIFIVAESVYSMDGDIAPLWEIKQIADRYSAILLIDEAHATGVLGPYGKGLIASLVKRDASIVSVHTGGKALGAAGAFVAASKTIVNYLINKARGFIYTTALPPIVPLQLINAIEKLGQTGDELCSLLRERSEQVRALLNKKLTVWHTGDGLTPIIPITIGDEKDALKVSLLLEERGLIVPAIRPPTVPAGTSRLRVNISLRHTKEELVKLAEGIAEVEKLV